jgi:hypothetical protein
MYQEEYSRTIVFMKMYTARKCLPILPIISILTITNKFLVAESIGIGLDFIDLWIIMVALPKPSK